MRDLQQLAESFKTKYERFITGCDAIELDEHWDKEADGEMDVYYENELLTVILRLIAADGRIGEAEIRYLNDAFGFDCDREFLDAVLENAGDTLEDFFENDFKPSVARLAKVNEKLAEAYKELFFLLCEIIAASDGVAEEEKALLKTLTL